MSSPETRYRAAMTDEQADYEHAVDTAWRRGLRCGLAIGYAAVWVVIALAIMVGRAGAEERRLPEYTFTVTAAEVDQLSIAINELPKRIADPLLAKLQAQALAQHIAAAKAAQPAAPPEPAPAAPK